MNFTDTEDNDFFFSVGGAEKIFMKTHGKLKLVKHVKHIQLSYYKYVLNDLIVMFLGHFPSVFEVLCFGVLFVLLFMF